MHSRSSPVRVIEYRVKYGQEEIISGNIGGVGTTLRGFVHFTSSAESHKGLCHGGAMCSSFDDIIGWTAFCVTGTCIPWSGYTVEVNSRLKKSVPLGSLLELECVVTKIERRKVYLHATLRKHVALYNDEEEVVYADADGLFILNKVHAQL